MTVTKGLKEKYKDEAKAALKEKFGYKNDMQIPKLVKVVLNMGVGEASHNSKLAEAIVQQLTKIAGQKALATKAKKSIASYKLREGMPVGAGKLGDYDSCSFSSGGQGRFRALDGATPFVGSIGEVHMEPETKVEVIFPESQKNRVLRAMLNAHPYEEPAYDLWTLNTVTNEQGLGRIGQLESPMTLKEFAQFVKVQLDVPALRVVGPLDRIVQKVAVIGGDGNKYVRTAIFAGADVFVTGDIGFHTAQDAEVDGLSIVDPGHHVEKVMIQGVATKMTQLCSEKKLQVNFHQSEIHTEPFKFV